LNAGSFLLLTDPWSSSSVYRRGRDPRKDYDPYSNIDIAAIANDYMYANDP
jgi:hypothetical protein